MRIVQDAVGFDMLPLALARSYNLFLIGKTGRIPTVKIKTAIEATTNELNNVKGWSKVKFKLENF